MIKAPTPDTSQNVQAELIMKLCDAFGPSNFEQDVAAVIKEELKGFTLKKDSMGNLFLLPDTAHSSQPAMFVLDAHMDEVGLIVSGIQENGLLRIQPLGGFNAATMVGQTFLIRTESGDLVRGIIGSIPVHYRKEQDMDPDALSLDIGCSSKEEVTKRGVSLGDPVTPDVSASYDSKTGLICAKALDDRIGVAAEIRVLEALQNEGFPEGAVEAVFTVQEEVGERGMLSAVKHLSARFGICFEGAPADDTFQPSDLAQTALNKGVMVRVKDGSMLADRALICQAKALAAEHHIPMQIAVRKAGGTNAAVLQKADIPTIVLGIPVRYAHSPAGFCTMHDFQSAIDLALALIRANLETENRPSNGSDFQD